MFSYELRQPGSPVRVTVTLGDDGWSLLEERPEGDGRRAHFTDWHRLERGMEQMDLAHLLHAPAVAATAFAPRT